MTGAVQSAHAHQRSAADPSLSVFVTANAGSGKTTTLVNRVARLLLKQVRPGEILCVTYTKAAAAEMQARLFDKLGRWAVADDLRLAEELSNLDGRRPEDLSAQELSEARRLFARALETPGGLRIQTIHAFCEKLLRRFPLEAGVAPGFEVLEDQATLNLSHAAREDLARLALTDPEGMVGEAYAHFAVELDFRAFHALLDTIEARRETLLGYLERIDAGLAPDPHELLGADRRRIGEIESDFVRWIDRREWLATAEALASGSSSDRECAERMRQAGAEWTFEGLGRVFLTNGEPRKRLTTKSAPVEAAAWLELLAEKYVASLDGVRASRIAEETRRLLVLARVHAALYESRKRELGALDFTDLVGRTAELLTRRASAAWVLYKLDGGIEHVLIDEAQDTAPEQWDILRALTEPFFAGDSGRASAIERTIFAVGDEKQSIYSFQGARPERLRQEARAHRAMIPNERFREVPLDTSFRSTEEILTFVDRTFAGPECGRALTGDSSGMKGHAPARLGQHGSVELWPLFADPDSPQPEAWNAPLDKEDARSGRKQLARALAQEIRFQVENGFAVWTTDSQGKPIQRAARYGDFIVLVRRRDATFEEIIRALKGEGLPVAGADRLKLKAHIVFDDLMALARFALFPSDDLSLAELLRSPFCDLADFGTPDALYPLADRASREERSLWSELQRRGDEHPTWSAARDLLREMIAARSRDPFAFFSKALNRVGPDGRSGRARVLDRLGREAEEAIDETLAQVLAAESRGGRDLETCLALLEQADVEVKREMEGARDEVRVMTVHGAKGLEAPIVILPDTTTRARPQGPSLMPVELEGGGEGWLMCPSSGKQDCAASARIRQARVDRTDAESLRLLYVALTRARDRLIVMGRRLGRPKEGFDAGSWWDVVAASFDRLKEEEPQRVAVLSDGRLRFGEEPSRGWASAAVIGQDLAPPDWTLRPPLADVAVRAASPSRMEGSFRVPAPSPLTGSGAGAASLGRFRRGDLIHRLLERLPDLDGVDRSAAAGRLMARERDLTEDQRQEMIEAALAVIEDERFAPVFGPGSRAEVAVAGVFNGVPVAGRMDRLVVTDDRILVVDYKTNRPPPETIELADPDYILQLAIYVSVLEQLYPDRPVEAALVWTDGPRLMPVRADLLESARTPR